MAGGGQPRAHFPREGTGKCPSSRGGMFCSLPQTEPPSPASCWPASALLTGRGAALGPKLSAHPDEPGAGDSSGLGVCLEKWPESHLPVVTVGAGCVGRAGGGRGGGRHPAWEPALAPRAAPRPVGRLYNGCAHALRAGAWSASCVPGAASGSGHTGATDTAPCFSTLTLWGR